MKFFPTFLQHQVGPNGIFMQVLTTVAIMQVLRSLATVQVVLSVTVILVDLSVAIMHVKLSESFFQYFCFLDKPIKSENILDF